MAELVVRGGTIVDGTGSERTVGDVAVDRTRDRSRGEIRSGGTTLEHGTPAGHRPGRLVRGGVTASVGS